MVSGGEGGEAVTSSRVRGLYSRASRPYATTVYYVYIRIQRGHTLARARARAIHQEGPRATRGWNRPWPRRKINTRVPRVGGGGGAEVVAESRQDGVYTPSGWPAVRCSRATRIHIVGRSDLSRDGRGAATGGQESRKRRGGIRAMSSAEEKRDYGDEARTTAVAYSSTTLSTSEYIP